MVFPPLLSAWVDRCREAGADRTDEWPQPIRIAIDDANAGAAVVAWQQSHEVQPQIVFLSDASRTCQNHLAKLVPGAPVLRGDLPRSYQKSGIQVSLFSPASPASAECLTVKNEAPIDLYVAEGCMLPRAAQVINEEKLFHALKTVASLQPRAAILELKGMKVHKIKY